MEYYPDVRKDQILHFATTWTELVSIMLNKISQKEKHKYQLISLIYAFEKNKREMVMPKKTKP